MRSTSVKVSVSTAVIVVLLSAAPLEAQRRTPARRESQVSRVVHLIRQAMSRTFGTIAQALPTIPIPFTTEKEEPPKSPSILPTGEEDN